MYVCGLCEGVREWHAVFSPGPYNWHRGPLSNHREKPFDVRGIGYGLNPLK